MVESQINDAGILVLDESGDFKILKGEQFFAYQDASKNESNVQVKTAHGPISALPTGNLPSTSLVLGLKPASSLAPLDTGLEEKMLAPLPPMVNRGTAAFYFHPQDEEEVSRLAKPLTSSAAKKYSLSKIVKKIVDNYQLVLRDDQQQKLSQAIYNFLRDRRPDIETLSLLKEPTAAGALALPEAIAESLLDFLKEIKGKISAAGGLVVEETLAEELPETAPAISTPLNKPLIEALTSKTALPVMPPPQPKPIPQAGLEQKISVKPIPPIASGNARFIRPERTAANQIMDVKKGSKLFGPVEELANLTLENFRRLSSNPLERTSKIAAKIDLLAKDSLIRRSAGIKAWKQSPLFNMYLAIGQASMEHNVEIKQVIDDYQKAGKPIMDLAEFEAISDLNRRLRF